MQIRAVVGEVDGRIVGIGGLAFLRNGAVLAFLNASDEARKFRVAMYRAAKAFFRTEMERGLTRINAIKDDELETAERFLSHLGFRHMADGVFTFGG